MLTTEGGAPSKLRAFARFTLTEVAKRGNGWAALKALGDAVNKSTASMDAAFTFFIVHVRTGSYVTSLEMVGCSITFIAVDAAMLALWDDFIHTAALQCRM